MSAYSEWKCGAISDDEYSFYARREYGERDYPPDTGSVTVKCENCIHCKEKDDSYYCYSFEDDPFEVSLSDSCDGFEYE